MLGPSFPKSFDIRLRALAQGVTSVTSRRNAILDCVLFLFQKQSGNLTACVM
jgi:hypothetical protein